MRGLIWRGAARALLLGLGLAVAGFFGAVLDEAFRGTGLAPFSPEFSRQYDGLWIVPGVIGFLIGLTSMFAKLRANKARQG